VVFNFNLRTSARTKLRSLGLAAPETIYLESQFRAPPNPNCATDWDVLVG